MSNQENAFDILVIGFDQALEGLVGPVLSPLKIKALRNSADIEGFLENFQLAPNTYVLVSTSTEGMGHLEVAQALSSYFQGLHLIFITHDRAQFQIESLKKNGFTESFLLPLDHKLLLNTIEEIKHKRSGGGTKKYKAVKLLDIQAGQELPFEVRTYLPRNKKYAILTGTGALTEKKMSILKQQAVNSVFIDTQQVEKFYEFAADQLINAGLASNDAVSQTEKSEKLKNNVRSLFRSILDTSNTVTGYDTGKDIMDQSKKIVESYVIKKTGLDIKGKLKEILGEGEDAYSHSQLVSTIACLLSMATGIGEAEDLAIAGLFHDIGIQGIKEDISIFELDKLSEDEKKLYMQHPKMSLNLLKEKKVTVTQKIADIIERHHERIDGKGFPSQLPEHKIPKEAQLLAYADAFEYLTRKKEGTVPLAPEAAHKVIVEKCGLSKEVLTEIEKFILAK